MADFNFYLNRVGVRGRQGERGEQGFSPIITVASNTLSEYVLQIQTQNNTFLTANLREHKDDLGGTYIRYNRETGVMYAGEPDYANTTTYGVVRYASSQDILGDAEGCVISPHDANDIIDARNYDEAIEAVDDKADANADNIATNTADITTLQGQMAGVLGNYVTTNTPQTISGMKTFSNGIRCLTLRDSSGTPYISFDPSAQNRRLLISDNTNFEQNVSVVGNLTTFRNNESNIVVDSGNISNYVGNGTITFTQGGVTKGTITTNQSGNTTIALDAGGGSSYTEGNGIDITNDIISVDSNVVALQTDLPNMNNYYNTTQVDLMLQDKADISEVPTKTSDLTNDSGFITSSDLPDVSNMVTTDTVQTITALKRINNLVLPVTANNTSGILEGSYLKPILVSRNGYTTIGNNSSTYGHLVLAGTTITVTRGGGSDIYTNIDSGNIGTYALTSLPIATTSALGGVIPDGTTVTVDANGVISASGGSTPSNMVTTDTAQTIAGAKTFSSVIGGTIGPTANYNAALFYSGSNNQITMLRSSSSGYSDAKVAIGGTPSKLPVFYDWSQLDPSTPTQHKEYPLISTYNIGTYALTSSNISTDTYIQALEARIAALEANINGGNA